jgi:hypothetical protein
MAAYIGLHHGLLQGAVFGSIALLVIVFGVVTYRWWVARSENRHIVRGVEDDQGSDQAPPGHISGGPA